MKRALSTTDGSLTFTRPHMHPENNAKTPTMQIMPNLQNIFFICAISTRFLCLKSTIIKCNRFHHHVQLLIHRLWERKCQPIIKQDTSGYIKKRRHFVPPQPIKALNIRYEWMLPREGWDFFFGGSSLRNVANRIASAGISSPVVSGISAISGFSSCGALGFTTSRKI